MSRLPAVVVLALAACSSVAVAQNAPTKTATPAKQAQPAAPQPAKPEVKAVKPEVKADDAAKKANEPGAAHKALEAFEGEWTCELKTFAPDGTSSVDKGTMTNKMVFGGRFLQEEYDGRMGGKFFRGGGLWGYNNATKKYETAWADSSSTGLSCMTGTVDAAGKVFTFTGETVDPASGKTVKQREVVTVVDKTTHRYDVFESHDGKESKVMEVTCTKAKAEKAPAPAKPADKKGG